MKWSKYNLLFNSEKYGFFLYNSFLNNFFKLDINSYKEIEELKNNPDNINENIQFHSELIKKRIFVDNNNIDFDNFHLQKMIDLFEKAYLSYTIIPTLDCNFRCAYCFEENTRPIYMSDQVISNVVNFIKQTTVSTKYLNLTWYGGEPLLNQKPIEEITAAIQKNDLTINSSIITNGYLLDKSFVDKLEKLNISFIQITLDGTQEHHNQRRPHFKNNDSFQKIIHNMDYLLKNKPKNTVVAIRVNVDNSNENKYFEVFTYINEQFGKQVNIYPGIIKDWNSNSSIQCGFDRNDEVNFIFDIYNKHGIIPVKFYPEYKQACVAQRIFDYVIGPEGELYKCWSDVGKQEFVVGNIKGDYVNTELLTKYLKSIDPFEDKKCKECFFFFVCGGGCPNQRLKNKFMGASFDTCTYFKSHLENFLEIHFSTKQDSTLIKELI